MNDASRKERILHALRDFGAGQLKDNALALFDVLGYSSQKRIELTPNTAATFRAMFDEGKRLVPQRALTDEWKSVDLLFQLTDAEIIGRWQGALSFNKNQIDNTVIESYLFFAVDLAGAHYTRTKLATVTREINKLFKMPALVLFRHGRSLTLAVVNREISRRDPSQDVLRKVTLIKDIDFADPLRAHIEILDDLSFERLYQDFSFSNFVGLHRAWEKRLASYALNERFYREVANWYFWALSEGDVVLPRSIETIRNKEAREKQRSIFFIRLLTRLIFCWFLQEKGLLPRDLFREHTAKSVVNDFSPKSGSYYRAILQNLFFATLNQEPRERAWRKSYEGARDGNRGVTTLWRYKSLLKKPEDLETLLRDRIPFVNGGLFECLDDQFSEPMVFLDGFSERKDNETCLPNDLFFGDEREIDLSATYDDQRRKREKVRGLIGILSRYKFTVEENTPLEEEIALDPELLGKVFENLLASYNEDTGTTARKALGAYYTPRKIVSYMIDESLRSYLANQVPAVPEDTLASLFREDTNIPALSVEQRTDVVRAIGRVKILDPACGSGAFPMGALHRMVDLLQRLDPNNESFKRDRLQDAHKYRELLRQANAPSEEIKECDARIRDIERSFDTRFHALDYARKFHLIENCIYGVDIQPIACQIAKLRFFIALIVDQHVDFKAPNLGVTPLPNLETRIVAADALVPIQKPNQQGELLDDQIRPLRRQLEQVRHDHFNARTPQTKRRCRERDAALRAQIAALLKDSGWPAQSAKALAAWDPYDQNNVASFFDTGWMFGFPVVTPAGLLNDIMAQRQAAEGFDVLIGNPPYVRIQTLKQQDPKLVSFYRANYESASKGNYDLYVVFVEAGLSLLKADGHLAYILPHKFFNAQYGESLRRLIARGHYLQHVVHFGHQQVFPGPANYVCLLFLAKAGTSGCRFVRVDDLGAWLNSFTGVEGYFPTQSIGDSDWNFTVGSSASPFDRLRAMPRTLADVTRRIFQGIKTSADKIYILDVVDQSKNTARVYSHQTGKEHNLETALLHPLVKGGDSRAFALATTNRLVLFPYQSVENGSSTLIAADKLKKDYPATWRYLCENREYLERRENGKMAHEGWYGYVYPKALDVMALPKLFTPDLAPAAAFSYDETGKVFFTGGVSGGYGILPAVDVSPKFLLGILNSRVVDFYHHNIATQMRGGWYSYESRFIKHLPIAIATESQETKIVTLVAYLIYLNRVRLADNAVDASRDTLMRGYFEQVLNALVYELHFPDELHTHGLNFFELLAQANLPELNLIEGRDPLPRLRETFERIYNTDHPIRGALHSLRSLELIRIIEGDE